MTAWIQQQSVFTLVGYTLMAMAGTAIPMWWAPQEADVVLGLVTLLVGGGGAFAVVERKKLEQLPLAIAPQLAYGWINGQWSLSCRSCLGLGRVMHKITISWVVDGKPMKSKAPVPVVVGPLISRVAVEQIPSIVEVTITCKSNREECTVSRVFSSDEIVAGRFVQGITLKPVRFDGQWATVCGEVVEEKPSNS